ncbi:50S ribosomal protein L15, chloroplastic [Coffea eugenioides]|uniref:Large ribosomal subunit protein uL15c n=1 Tax=Coffea arabica TaxID=13443 RepID=A0A6P6VD32_COFAR|nr:50S ribosomal protein L15, chloroplastic-like [Coffea arabica]XP_027152736.1 50S ribosomal protein L15, chloroplastic [Coffea eugenioides]
MAALLSLSSPTPTRTSSAVHHHPSSPFKGNVRNFKANPSFVFPSSVRITDKTGTKQRAPLIVLNKAYADSSSSSIQAASGISSFRFRLNNLGPQPGSTKKAKRKGRGHSAGQGGSCGFGMRGQKSRSGPGVRKGFEGGQMPLYRRIPKLRGIAGGMHAGLPKYVPVNLKDVEDAGFQEGEEVSLESLKKKGLINPSGRERRLPLKILGDGELSVKLSFKARAFSASAKEKLEAAGCSLMVLPGRKKWVKPSVAKNLARAAEYFAKKNAAAAESADPSS